MKRRYLVFVAIAAAAILAAGGILVVSRNSRVKPKVQAQRYPHQHLSSSEWETTATLRAGSYTLREGDSLASIATRRYGHQKYFDIIKLHNHLPDAFSVPAGAKVDLPDVSTILTETGFTRVAAAEMEMILCSRAKYDKVESQLWALRRDRPLRERVVVPQKMRQELLEAADDLQQATESLKKARPGVNQPPAKMIGQLEDAMRGMRELAEGANDGYGYDIDMVKQRYAHALTYGIIWARERFN